MLYLCFAAHALHPLRVAPNSRLIGLIIGNGIVNQTIQGRSFPEFARPGAPESRSGRCSLPGTVIVSYVRSSYMCSESTAFYSGVRACCSSCSS